SRIYYFHNNGQEEMYLGSADMMQRNLDTRVETLFPIESPVIREVILKNKIRPVLKDTANTHILQPDGSYLHIGPLEGEEPFDSQAWFITHPILNTREEEVSHEQTISAIPSSA